jgi:hypothetical protein
MIRVDLRRRIRKTLHRWRKKRTRYDAYLFSFPKCGRTWLTLQLGRLFQQVAGLGEVPNLLKLDLLAAQSPRLPKVRITHEDQPHRKTPDELTTSKEPFRGKKVIFMVRDPRDVVVSYYFHKSRREKPRKFWFFQRKRRRTHSPFTGTLSEFLDVEIGGFDTVLQYYNIWAANRDVPEDLLVVRYEEMHADPHAVLRRVAEFIGLGDVSDELIDDAVEFSRFDRMRRIEAGAGTGSYKLKPADPKDAESFKTRRGKAGGYVDYLSPEEIERLNAKMAARLSDFYGYEPNRGLRDPHR